ncbi:unnamed protein product [Protopolystoma xenopodis]|uniref:Uncharacterized protein n=1 Tax=Protopolystoma xenopodis TaxID=117903 RepID=A0A448XF51_9PLAT|nr:unnamed protein product [Protopolystoma xenopodis]
MFCDKGFLVYAAALIVLNGVLIFLAGPRVGKTNPLVYITISGSIGSLSVMACKGVGVGIKRFVTLWR